MASVASKNRAPDRGIGRLIKSRATRTERYNADMRLWARLLIWATRHC
jgi:hypothetical protein